MKSWPFSLIALLILFGPATAQEAESPLSLTFIGNEAMAISDGRMTLVSDFPYLSGYSVHMDYDPAWLTLAGDVVSLITHRHQDHFQPGLFKSMGWRIIGPPEVTQNVPPHRVIAFAPDMDYGDIAVTAIPTPHSTVEHYSYLVEWRGISFYFPGDTETLDAFFQLEREVDILFSTPWVLRPLLLDGTNIPAKHIIYYHQTATEDLRPCDKCVALMQGQTLQLGDFLSNQGHAGLP